MPATVDAPYGGGCADVVNNINVIQLVETMDRMAGEWALCVSASLNAGFTEHDHKRAQDYLADFKGQIDYIMSQPIPDAPKTHGRLATTVPEVKLAPDAELDWRTINIIENSDIKNLLRQMQSGRVEVTRNQSALLTQGFLEPDKARMLDCYQRMLNLIAYGAAHQPSDTPETTPSVPPVEPGM